LQKNTKQQRHLDRFSKWLFLLLEPMSGLEPLTY
jgi:hypothetical protein